MIVIRFEPQPDITAYELAQLLKCYTYNKSDKAKEMFGLMPNNVKRHVIIVSDDSDKKSWVSNWISKIRYFIRGGSS